MRRAARRFSRAHNRAAPVRKDQDGHEDTLQGDEKLEGARSLVQGAAKELVAVDGSRDALAPDRPDFPRSGHAATALEPNLFSLTTGLSEGHYELDGRPGHNMLITHDEVGAERTHIASLAYNFYVTIADADDAKGKLQAEPLRSAAFRNLRRCHVPPKSTETRKVSNITLSECFM